MGPTDAMLWRAVLASTDLRGLFLVGGASRVPLVATLLHRRLGVAPTVLDQPEIVVAEEALAAAAPPPAMVPPATDLTPTPYLPATPLSATPYLPATPLAPTASPPATPLVPTPSPPATPVASTPYLPATPLAPTASPPRTYTEGFRVDVATRSSRVDAQTWGILAVTALVVVGFVAIMNSVLPRALGDGARVGADVAAVLAAIGIGLAAARYTCAPVEHIGVGIDVTDRGITVQHGDTEIAVGWDDVASVKLLGGDRLAVQIWSGEVAGQAFDAPGVELRDGELEAGPLSSDVLGELAATLSHHGGERFLGVGARA
ncbi:MAG TPA: hypothetical protein VE172_07765 [Stackebrandtia sp.]|uniref:hypothetical protein n=1 Tax=Stackebrandtia sp. TaxID=2023065 RepID=UPI002D5433D6|nr:hypothetical protein [Stackebrandtia sp.]HZE38696.1 hypothetical protein [Stackebrandtia sp.]